jgi:hypothetical protein
MAAKEHQFMTKTVRNVSVVIAGIVAIFVVVMLIAAGQEPNPNANPAFVEAQRHMQEVIDNQNFEHQRVMRELEIRYVNAKFSDSEGDLFYKCTNEPPPTHKANQERCQNLMARVKRAHEADAKADARAKANW